MSVTSTAKPPKTDWYASRVLLLECYKGLEAVPYPEQWLHEPGHIRSPSLAMLNDSL